MCVYMCQLISKQSVEHCNATWYGTVRVESMTLCESIIILLHEYTQI